ERSAAAPAAFRLRSERRSSTCRPPHGGPVTMANGDFRQGTWNKLPDNCTRSVTLTWFRCAEYGLVFVSKCLTWAVKTEVECIEWTWKSTKECSWWAVLFCVLWSIIVTLVCVAYGIVTSRV